MVYADVNILGGSVCTIKENAEALRVANKEIGLEVNADKTKFMVISGNQNAGWYLGMKTDNSSFERVEEFKYLVTIQQIKIIFRKKLRSDWSQGILAIIWCKICLPVCYPKI